MPPGKAGATTRQKNAASAARPLSPLDRLRVGTELEGAQVFGH